MKHFVDFFDGCFGSGLYQRRSGFVCRDDDRSLVPVIVHDGSFERQALRKARCLLLRLCLAWIYRSCLAFTMLLSFTASLALIHPFINALADELAQIFNFAS